MTDRKPHQVFIIDDHPIMRVGLQRVIETDASFQVCGEYGKGRGAVDAILQSNADIILLDLSLPDGSGLELIKDLRAVNQTTPVLVVSMHDECLYAERVLKAGANGYIMKQEASDNVIQGLTEILNGDIFVSQRLYRRMLKRMTRRSRSSSDQPSLELLSDREFEVFELIGRGVPTREIAETLNISTKTVDAHRANIKDKLGLTNGQEVVRYAVRWLEAGKV